MDFWLYLLLVSGYILMGITIPSIIVYSSRMNPQGASPEDLPVLMAIGFGWPAIIVSAIFSYPAYYIFGKWFSFLNTRP